MRNLQVLAEKVALETIRLSLPLMSSLKAMFLTLPNDDVPLFELMTATSNKDPQFLGTLKTITIAAEDRILTKRLDGLLILPQLRSVGIQPIGGLAGRKWLRVVDYIPIKQQQLHQDLYRQHSNQEQGSQANGSRT